MNSDHTETYGQRNGAVGMKGWIGEDGENLNQSGRRQGSGKYDQPRPLVGVEYEHHERYDNKSWGYPFNRTDVGWGGGSPSLLARTIRGPWASSRPGSAPMRTAWTTWSGCGGPLASSARSAATTEAGGWAMDATGAPGAAAGRR